jgi:DNA-directed RNA polymerase specialized sigma24 family protein
MLPGMLVIIVVTLVVWTLSFLYFRNYLRRRTGSRRILEEFQEEVDKLIAEINNATDQGLTLMEDRINSLKTLLEETDKRISVYKKETEKRTMHDRSYAELGRRTIVKNDTPSLFPPEDISDSNVPPPEEKNVPLSNEVPRFVRSSIRVEPKTPFAEQVLHLANAGFSAELIAKNLGTSIAEVELAINLAERNMSEE